MVYEVSGVSPGPFPNCECPGLHLKGLKNWPAGCCAGCFRKIQPYQERFAEQLRSALPAKEVA